MAVGEHFGIVVNSKDEVLYECIKGNFVDCRINAYTDVVDSDIDAGLVAPTIIFIDIDQKLFSNTEEFEKCVENTKDKIHEVLGISPVYVWSGGGAHI